MNLLSRMGVGSRTGAGMAARLVPPQRATALARIATALAVTSMGALTLGAVAVGALAIRALAVRTLVVRSARFRRLEVGEFVVGGQPFPARA